MNAVVVTFEHLPIHLLGCYGNQWIETPHFDRLAAESIVFDNHFGENFDPAAADHAWKTGRYQFPLSAQEQRGQRQVFDALGEAGVKCVYLEQDLTIEGFTHDAVRWLEELASDDGDRWLLWLHYSGCATGSKEGESLTADPQRTRDLQAARVLILDQCVGELRQEIATNLSEQPPLLIVTAAQGALLRDPPADQAGLPTDCALLREEVVHTPLFVSVPGGEMGSRRRALVQTVDFAPTLLDWFGIPRETLPCEGKSLLPLVRDDATELRDALFLGNNHRSYGVRTQDFYLVTPRFRQAGEPETSTGGSPLPETARERLYVKPDDIWDVNDVAGQYPDEVERLTSLLQEFLKSIAGGPQGRGAPGGTEKQLGASESAR